MMVERKYYLRNFILILQLLLLFTACFQTKTTVYLDDATQDLLGLDYGNAPEQIFPQAMQEKLEESWKYERVIDKQEAQILFQVKTIKWNSAEQEKGELGRIFISKEFLIPVVNWSDRRDTISFDILLNESLPDGITLAKFENLKQGQKGLAIDGLYPVDEGYPLFDYNELVIEYGPAANKNSRSTKDIKLNARLADFAAETISLFQIPDVPEQKEDIIWVASTGDIMTMRGVERQLLNEEGLEKTFGGYLEILQQADLLTGNLEGAVTRRGNLQEKSYNFKLNPQVVPRLMEAGFDYMMVTNNHSFDYGLEGFKDTLKYLDEYGMGYSGAGSNESEASSPWITEIKGKTFSIYSLGAYPVELRNSDGSAAAEATKDRAGILLANEKHIALIEQRISENPTDYCIIMVHGGFEYHNNPSRAQVQLYRRLVDMGADVVFGSHPHVLQGTESWNHGVIFYSLGNYIFPGFQYVQYGEDTLVPVLGFYNGRVLYQKLYPGIIEGTTVDLENVAYEESTILHRFFDLKITGN